MEEIEVKIIEIDKDKIVNQLLEMGAKKVFEGDIHAVFYDFEDNCLANNDSLIRLRKKGNKAYLTYKKKITQEGAKVMTEIESEVSDFDSMHELLQEINLRPEKDCRKKRISYQIGDVLFEFDEYNGIPVYLEIEAPTIDLINEYIEKLGIDRSKVKSWTGKELFEHYGIKSSYMKI